MNLNERHFPSCKAKLLNAWLEDLCHSYCFIMRTLLKISYQHLPFTVHSLVPVKTQNKLYLLTWYRMGYRSIMNYVCSCTRKPPCRKTASVAWPWESTAWTFSDVDDWGSELLFSVLWEYILVVGVFFPSPKNAGYKTMKFQFSNKGEEKWPNINCKWGSDFCTGKWLLPSGSSLKRHTESFSYLLLFTPFLLQSTKQLIFLASL